MSIQMLLILPEGEESEDHKEFVHTQAVGCDVDTHEAEDKGKAGAGIH